MNFWLFLYLLAASFAKGEEQSKPCSLCWDGSSPADPQQDVTWILEEWESVREFLPQNTTVNCFTLSFLVGFIDETDDTCGSARINLGGICGCPPIENRCDICPNDEGVPNPEAEYIPAEHYVGLTMSCGDLLKMTTQLPVDHDFCKGIKMTSYVCGCDGGKRVSLGANTDLKRAFLAWVPRLTSLLSICGSFYILQDVARHHRNNLHHRLVFGMSLFDVFSSLCFLLSTVPMPRFDTRLGVPTALYGAVGNDATCTAQGFFLQLGMVGSTGFIMSLSVYYLMVIVHGYTELRLKKLALFFQVPPVLIALGIAFAAIPQCVDAEVVCSIFPGTDFGHDANYSIFFSILPLGFCIVASSGILIYIYCCVRATSRRANKWRFQQAGMNHSVNTQLTRNNNGSFGNLSGNGNSSSNIGSNRDLSSSRESGDSGSKRLVELTPGGDENSMPSLGMRIRSICMRFRQQGRGGAGGRSKIENTVFWPAASYLAAFMLTWPFYFAAQLGQLDSVIENYPFWLLVVFMTPLQGFFNFFVYIRPRVAQHYEKQKKEKERDAKRRAMMLQQAPAPVDKHEPIESHCEEGPALDPVSPDEEMELPSKNSVSI